MGPQHPEQLAGDRPFRRQAIFLLLVLVFSPLCLRSTSTTISEDIVILLFFACSALWWRRGWPFSAGVRWTVDFLMFAFLFIVVWRGQVALVADWGRLIYWPMVCLVAAACLAGGAHHREAGPLRLLPLALLISLGGLVVFQLILPATLPYRPSRYRVEFLVPAGLVLPGLFSLALIVRSARYEANRRLYIAIPILFGLIAGGRGWHRDTSTLVTWWNASRLERSVRDWCGEDTETAGETRRLYSRVLNTLEQSGGRLVRSEGLLDLLLRCRVAEVARRMHQPARMLASLRPGIWTTPQSSRLLTNLWSSPELDRLRRAAENPRYLLSLRSPHKPDAWESQSSPDLWEFHVDLYVDHELAADGSVIWLLDRWGRVFRSQGDSPLEPVWEAAPGEGRSDAADLEVWGETMAVAFASGEVRLGPGAPSWFPQPWRMPLRPGHRLVDMERHPCSDGALALSSDGQFSIVGSLPEAFPVPQEPLFSWDAAADLEISPDGLGWYVLDVFGVIHAKSGGDRLPMAVDVPDSAYWTIQAPNAPYWSGQDMALDIRLDPLGRGICLLNRLGEAWTIADPPYRPVYRPFEGEAAMGLGVSLAVRQDGAMVLLYAPGNLVVVQ